MDGGDCSLFDGDFIFITFLFRCRVSSVHAYVFVFFKKLFYRRALPPNTQAKAHKRSLSQPRRPDLSLRLLQAAQSILKA